MSALIRNIDLFDSNTTVTTISTNARIDYILRFSKQAILVIDESAQQNTQILNQVIATIPEQHNAAYVSLSAQFNDIQIRCRIIEQLSSDELFDPEVSLAVSIINITKRTQQALSIVLNHAEHLSLQLLHEITQLSSIAKKANLIIDIVMFGLPQTGVTIKDHKSIFHNKLTLLSAHSGQLLSINSAIFQNSKGKWYAVILNKWLLAAIIFFIVTCAALMFLFQQDSFHFTETITSNSDKETKLSKVLTEPQTTVLNKEGLATINNTVDTKSALTQPEAFGVKKPTEENIAAPKDILAAMDLISLTDDVSNPTQDKENTSELAELESIEVNTIEPNIIKSVTPKLTELPSTKAQAIKLTNSQTFMSTEHNYYLDKKEGFAIQLGAYSDLSFMDDFSSVGVTVHFYNKMLNEKSVFVATSPVYIDLLSAEQALLKMPPSIKARQIWIKPIHVIHQEINLFKSTL